MKASRGFYLILLLERLVWGLIPAAVVVALVLAGRPSGGAAAATSPATPSGQGDSRAHQP
ncbi:hypothetical protein QMK33_20835 [Hymenobacter sp. H14-R3]|uniref:hypothetical protein n=1 Tax=Hymenobacter sp. H14-R3 TaxID=3046308 RepID=UPI0024BA1585|nr:hypothetical protein [Hymenobacter sp. H14-R3]MDJ0367600.1 hypothetical protein [Hymenobacter sp. H14-R3]